VVEEGGEEGFVGEEGGDDGLHGVGYDGEGVEVGEGLEEGCVLGVEGSEAESAGADVFAQGPERVDVVVEVIGEEVGD